MHKMVGTRLLTGKILSVVVEPLGVEGCATGCRLVRPSVVCKQQKLSSADQAESEKQLLFWVTK
jgi:hypothetical protein